MDWFWSPMGFGVLWLVLHSADYLLTVATARLRMRGNIAERMHIGGSIELNPVFVKAVDKGQWLSGRFLSTLALGAVVLPFTIGFLQRVARDPRNLDFAVLPEALCGLLFWTRFAVISGHLQNLVLLRRMLHVPEASIVSMRYDRGTLMTITRSRKLELAASFAISAFVSGRPFFYGGLAGSLLLVGMMFLWGRRRAPSPPASTTPAP